jgi:hypothetical protein
MALDPTLAAADYCYVTTTGRVTGRPHTPVILSGKRAARRARAKNLSLVFPTARVEHAPFLSGEASYEP